MSGRESDLSAVEPERYATLDGYADDVLDAVPGARPAAGDVRRALGQRDDGRTGRRPGARRLRRARAARSVALLRRRPGDRVPGRFQRRRHRRAPGVAGGELPGLVGRDGSGDHGQSRAARAGRGADQQLLPHRPGHRPGLRPRHVPVRQPGRSGTVPVPTLVAQCSSDAIAPPEVGAFVHAANPGQPAGHAERHRPLPTARRTARRPLRRSPRSRGAAGPMGRRRPPPGRPGERTCGRDHPVRRSPGGQRRGPLRTRALRVSVHPARRRGSRRSTRRC